MTAKDAFSKKAREGCWGFGTLMGFRNEAYPIAILIFLLAIAHNPRSKMNPSLI